MGTLYDDDVVAWAEQQAALIRARQWSQLDIDNVAEEIEDVGKSDKRALRNHLMVLMVQLLKWAYQPVRRGGSWARTIGAQRTAIIDAFEDSPSLKTLPDHPDWLAITYRRAVWRAEQETGLKNLPVELPWTLVELMNYDFLPPPAAAPAESDKKRH